MAKGQQQPPNGNGIRPPAPGPSETVEPVDFADPFQDLPDTGRHLIMSLPPGKPESDEMARWIASVENRMRQQSGGGGGGSGRDSDPVPRYARKTQTVIDYIKWLGTAILFLVGLGWLGHEYVSQFQTSEEAAAAQVAVNEDLDDIEDAVVENEQSIDNLGVYSVQIRLEQKNANSRLDQLLELEQAENSRERATARRRVNEIQRSIDRREHLIRDPQALRRVADRVENDPLGGLDDL